jgi:hypothetical protein
MKLEIARWVCACAASGLLLAAGRFMVLDPQLTWGLGLLGAVFLGAYGALSKLSGP